MRNIDRIKQMEAGGIAENDNGRQRIMQFEKFKNRMEFKRELPSGLFVCTNCGELLANPRECDKCGYRADGLFGTMEKGIKLWLESEAE